MPLNLFVDRADLFNDSENFVNVRICDLVKHDDGIANGCCDVDPRLRRHLQQLLLQPLRLLLHEFDVAHPHSRV